MHCPFCETKLPDDATQCTRCDWVREPDLPPSRKEDWVAAALSFVPGLGHLCKGHLVPGLILLCLAGPAFLVIVFSLIPATFGLSLVLPAVFIVFTAVHAFHLPDVRNHPGIREQAIRTISNWGKWLIQRD